MHLVLVFRGKKAERGKTVEVCDATGDAMKYHSRAHKKTPPINEGVTTKNTWVFL